MVKELEVFIGTMYFKLLRLLLQTRSRNVFIDTQIMRNKLCKKINLETQKCEKINQYNFKQNGHSDFKFLEPSRKLRPR